MTRDDIIRMAREADLIAPSAVLEELRTRDRAIQRFASLVAAQEREECARVCDAKVDAEYATGKVDHNEMGWTQACAIEIRARGQQ